MKKNKRPRPNEQDIPSGRFNSAKALSPLERYSSPCQTRSCALGENKEVPFYKNTSDGTHCFQAVLKMVMKYFWPKKSYSWKELEDITAKEEGLWTWPMAGLIYLKKRGVKIKIIESFDYGKFIHLGEEYLIEEYGKEVGEASIKNSNIIQEIKIAEEFTRKIAIKNKIPTIKEIKNFLIKGYLIICHVNARKLNNKDGYSGHFVVVKGFDDRNFFLHDPGLPPRKDRSVNFDLFEKSWAYPDKKTKTIIALKLQSLKK